MTTIAAHDTTATLQIDRAHSEVHFQVRHLLTKVRGHFSDFEGQIAFDTARPEASSVTLTSQASSLDTRHLRLHSGGGGRRLTIRTARPDAGATRALDVRMRGTHKGGRGMTTGAAADSRRRAPRVRGPRTDDTPRNWRPPRCRP